VRGDEVREGWGGGGLQVTNLATVEYSPPPRLGSIGGIKDGDITFLLEPIQEFVQHLHGDILPGSLGVGVLGTEEIGSLGSPLHDITPVGSNIEEPGIEPKPAMISRDLLGDVGLFTKSHEGWWWWWVFN